MSRYPIHLVGSIYDESCHREDRLPSGFGRWQAEQIPELLKIHCQLIGDLPG